MRGGGGGSLIDKALSAHPPVHNIYGNGSAARGTQRVYKSERGRGRERLPSRTRVAFVKCFCQGQMISVISRLENGAVELRARWTPEERTIRNKS